MDYAAESLKLHKEWKGKIEVVCRAPLNTRDDLSLAYTPGVAAALPGNSEGRRIKSYDADPPLQPGGRRHRRHRGAGPGRHRPGGGHARYGGQMRPVQGLRRTWTPFRCACAPKSVDDIVNTVRLLAGSFGGVNLEDISAPRCFEIERRLEGVLRYPRFSTTTSTARRW